MMAPMRFLPGGTIAEAANEPGPSPGRYLWRFADLSSSFILWTAVLTLCSMSDAPMLFLLCSINAEAANA